MGVDSVPERRQYALAESIMAQIIRGANTSGELSFRAFTSLEGGASIENVHAHQVM